MTRDREAALRDLLGSIHAALEPATPGRVGAVRVLLKGLMDGPLDNVAVQGAAGVLPLVLQDLAPGPARSAEHSCGRCGNPVRVPGEISNGKPTIDARFCDACIDRCHEATEFDHICQVCASPEEARARGWAVAR